MSKKNQPFQSDASNRRGWNLLVLPKFQVWLLVVNLMAVVFTLGIVGYHGISAFQDLNLLGSELGLDSEHPYFKFIQTQKAYLFGSFWKACLISIGVSSLALLCVSHRLAGPMIRMKWFFRQLGTLNEVTRTLTFRDGDWVASLPIDINAALKRVSSSRQISGRGPGLRRKKTAGKSRRRSA